MSPQQIVMLRESLEDIPEHPLPEGISIRWYVPGDRRHWLDIHREADALNDITSELFERSLGHDDSELSQRQCFLLDRNGRPVGTGTAWYGEIDGRSCGRVHWIAIRPSMQGRGLAKPLLSIILQRFRELGHTCAFLTTRPERVEAIHLYRNFGFRPYVMDDRQRKMWGAFEWKNR